MKNSWKEGHQLLLGGGVSVDKSISIYIVSVFKNILNFMIILLVHNFNNH